ncbi:MAG: hypothetical protein L7F78_15895 [Syntrophales bacterium LBB04]|nr:hypothetical protein [Syntrophales bacterium LBB04]
MRGEDVSIRVVSECVHCKRPMYMEIDSDMNNRCQDSGCIPMIFVPDVDFQALKEPNIIEAF